ncbi:hypothetical protein ig2599ANME_2408 [groundwater metagenome]
MKQVGTDYANTKEVEAYDGIRNHPKQSFLYPHSPQK